MRLIKLLFAGALALNVANANDKLIIDALDFKMDDKKGISIFTGDVKMKMSQDKLNAQKVEIYFENTKDGKNPTKYIATGKVDFEINTNDKHYKGNGEKLIYEPSKQKYLVSGNGYLEDVNTNRKIYGEEIYVDQLSGEASVKGTEKKPVRFIINLENKETQKGENK